MVFIRPGRLPAERKHGEKARAAEEADHDHTARYAADAAKAN